MNDHNNPYYLQPAELDWQDGVPCASDFGDVYFSRDDGSAEVARSPCFAELASRELAQPKFCAL
ncbi:hypothetical protein, partial [uncultured Spongiibacter sp.]|uniref:hypothetical protein n=1 Tax=uncultured Spongiibacter sp. TaxID=870896 RepID=UPI002589516D